MHAVRLHTFGPAENLTYETTDDPVPGPGQVRIAVAAAGVHLLDTALREGMTGPFPAPAELPTVPGREVAGTVECSARSTDPGLLGKRVVAHLGTAPGGYAELAVTDADRLHEIPPGLDDAEAVAMIGTGRTDTRHPAVHRPRPRLRRPGPGRRGRHRHPARAVRQERRGHRHRPGRRPRQDRPRSAANGADLAVDYTLPDWPRQVRAHLDGLGRRATVVYDSVGGVTGRAAVDLLGKGGQHIVFGWSGEGLHNGSPLTFTDEELAERGITSQGVLGPAMMQKAGGLRVLEERALAEAAAGRLRPAVQRFPLAEAAAAHRALETRGTMGKVVLVP